MRISPSAVALLNYLSLIRIALPLSIRSLSLLQLPARSVRLAMPCHAMRRRWADQRLSTRRSFLFFSFVFVFLFFFFRFRRLLVDHFSTRLRLFRSSYLILLDSLPPTCYSACSMSAMRMRTAGRALAASIHTQHATVSAAAAPSSSSASAAARRTFVSARPLAASARTSHTVNAPAQKTVPQQTPVHVEPAKGESASEAERRGDRSAPAPFAEAHRRPMLLLLCFAW